MPCARPEARCAGTRPAVVVAAALLLAAAVGGMSVLLLRDDPALARGRVLYDAHCASCHGVDLEGQPDWQGPGPDGLYPAPPHDATGHTWHHSDSVLIDYITLGGAAALARMGVAFDSGMPAFGDVLDTSEVADILAYIKSRWPERERDYQARLSATADE